MENHYFSSMVRLTLFFVLLVTFSALAQEWKQDTNNTQVSFVIKNFGINVDGNFGKVTIKTNLTTNNLSNSYLRAGIKVASINTGNKNRDQHLRKKTYFDEANYPEINLKSTRFKKNSDGNLTMFAELTLKGITRKVSIPLQVEQANGLFKIWAKFQLNRRDFNVGKGSFVLSKKVTVDVQFYGIQQP